MAEPRVILVMGARKGIGRALAQHDLARCDTVVGLSREPSDLLAPALQAIRRFSEVRDITNVVTSSSARRATW